MLDFNNLPAQDKIYYRDESVVIYCADCRLVLPLFPDKSFDLVLTDPPYPDYYTEEYKFDVDLIRILQKYTCRQFIFWSSRTDYPLTYSAIHIWDKQNGIGTGYERLYEVNGSTAFKVFNHYRHNNELSARWCDDHHYDHPSQKPIKLIREILSMADFTIVLDPFLGSGTTAVAAKILGRKCVGIEISEKYCEIAARRCSQSVMQLDIPKESVEYQGRLE